jgi:hypothetical protein
MKEITTYIVDTIKSNNSVYYSVENNTLGEAALMAISEIGEENIPGIFLSEPKRAGQTRTYRKGFTTSNKSKLMVCAKLKHLIESKKLMLASKNVISELKNFVAAGITFKAKPGETDDLVMALLLAVRMMLLLQEFDAKLDNELREEQEVIEPMPFIMLGIGA